jgi:hypothetical protein
LTFTPTLSGLGAFLSTVSLPVLALSSNTFLGATITVSLLPVILVLAQDALVNRKIGFLLIVVYTAYFLFSPVSLMIPIIASVPYIGYSGVRHLRRSAKMILGNAVFLLGCFFAININPLVYKLYTSKQSDILSYVFASSPGIHRQPMDSLHQQLSWNLFWHTLGVGPIMASPTTTLNALSEIVLGVVVLIGFLYLVGSILRRDFSILFFSYLSFWLVVLIGGIGGVFRSFEILSRVSQQFVSLHSLVYLSFVHKKEPFLWKGWLRTVGIVLPLLLVTTYPFVPFWYFERQSLVDNTQRVNQYYQSSLRARADVSKIVGQSPVLVSSSIPTFTGMFNTVSLFSNIRLAIPPSYFKFFFDHFSIGKTHRPNDYFCTPAVLTSELYTDIYDKDDEDIVYRKNGVRLSRNDLILIFDNDTFEIKNGFDAEFLKARSLVQARKLSRDTIIRLCSARARTVRFIFRYTPPTNGRVFTLSVNPGPASDRMVFASEGTVTTRPFVLSKGVNQIELRPESSGDQVEILRISVKDER